MAVVDKATQDSINEALREFVSQMASDLARDGEAFRNAHGERVSPVNLLEEAECELDFDGIGRIEGPPLIAVEDANGGIRFGREQ